ncbi:hypothetical protein A3K64_04305 [Candidatus Micrarchaeota archaeon RBG_16_36_9]|nr:MAG: hypothetical protein A3K64_04305 [Candidatus Micrarchaeota archaeon RBG_16_36_9]
MPQLVAGDIMLLGGVYLIKSLFESQSPQLDLIFLVTIFIASYLIACLLTWVYENKINKVIANAEEMDVPPPEEDDEETEDK